MIRADACSMRDGETPRRPMRIILPWKILVPIPMLGSDRSSIPSGASESRLFSAVEGNAETDRGSAGSDVMECAGRGRDS